MDLGQILELLKNGGPLTLAALGWFMFFRRDRRVEQLEDERVTLLREVLAVTQRVTDMNHIAMALARPGEDIKG